MAPHSSTLAWKIPWTEEPGGLQSMGSLRVRHNQSTSLSLFTLTHWRRRWQPTPVFLPGESQGRGSLVGCRLWGRTGSDTTEATWRQQQFITKSGISWVYPLKRPRLFTICRKDFWDLYSQESDKTVAEQFFFDRIWRRLWLRLWVREPF